MLVVGICLAVTAVFLGAAVLINWFTQARAAEQAAELAALAAVSASVDGGAPCAAAAHTAARNGASVAGCEVRGEGRHVVVEVAVLARLSPQLPGAPTEVRRVATAGTA